MSDPTSGAGLAWFERALTGWIALVARAPLLVIAASLLLTALFGAYAALAFRIDTDSTNMLSEELPFRQRHERHRALFPQFSDSLTVIVDAPDIARADAAVEDLALLVASDPGVFESLYEPGRDPFFRANGLLYLDPETLEDMADRMIGATALLSAMARDPSLRGVFGVLGVAVRDASADEPRVGFEAGFEKDPSDHGGLAELLDKVAAVADARAAGAPKTLRWSDLLAGEDGESVRRLVLVRLNLDYGALQPAAAAIKRLRAAAERVGKASDGSVRLRLTGAKALEYEELKSVEANIGLSGGISLLLVALALALGLRSARLGVGILYTLVVGLVWTGAFAMLAVGSLNLISVAFAVLFIGLGVDFGVHLGLRYREAARVRAHGAALRDMAVGCGRALFLCAATGVIAFLSFQPTAYRGLSELGLISGVGLIIAVALSFTILPAWLSAFRNPGPAPTATPTAGTAGAAWLDRHARSVVIGAAAVGVACLAAVPGLRFDFDPMSLRDQQSESVLAFRDLTRDARTNPYHLVLLSPSLAEADAATAALRALPEVDSTRTLSDFLPSDQDAKLEVIDAVRFLLGPVLAPDHIDPAPDDAAREESLRRFRTQLATAASAGSPPDLAGAAARLDAALGPFQGKAVEMRFLEDGLAGSLPELIADLRLRLAPGRPVTLADLPDMLAARMVAADGAARIEIYPAIPVDRDGGLARFVEAVQAVAPEVTGTPAIVLAAGDAVIASFVQALVLALALILLVLWIVLRNPVDMAFVMTPLILAALMTMAASVLFDLPFNFANVIVIPLLFGLGVDSGVHIVMRAREGPPLGTSTARAVVVSALTTIGSFGSLAISSHAGAASMGVLLTIAILCTMVSTLLVLPALLAMRR